MTVTEKGRPLRWGILSTARIADEVVPGLHASLRNDLVAVASRTEASALEFASRHRVDSVYGSYEGLLDAADIDCVYVPLPNKLHAKWVEAAILRGKHVLCEKPLVSSAVEAERLFKLADECGVHLAEAFMYRHHPKTHVLAELVRSGRIGQVHTVRTSFCFMTSNPSGDIRFNPDLEGGALRDVGSYCVSLSNLVLDAEPRHVRAASVASDTGVAERFYGIMEYASGAVAQFDCSMRSPLSVHASVLGDLGEIILPMPWYSHRPPHEIRVLVEGQKAETISLPTTNAYFLETEHFAEVVLGDRAPVVPASETIRNIATLERLAAAESDD